MAQSRRGARRLSRQLSGVKQTPRVSVVAAANDPKRTYPARARRALVNTKVRDFLMPVVA